MSSAPAGSRATGAEIAIHVGAGFAGWLAGADATVVITTYQAGKIVFVDCAGDAVTVLVRDLHAPMGLAVDGDRLAVALREEVIVLRDAPDLAPDGFEHRYVPAARHPTGDVRAHEIGFGRDGLWIVNTRWSCLGVATDAQAFEPRWRPAFVSALAAEDRCHLSGLAMEDGAPAYVTAHGATDTPGGWRDGKASGGVVVDVARGQPLAGGFAMPHSPRIVDGALWLLDSGRGALVRVDRATGARTGIAVLPGFTRGLAFVGRHALVGLSKIRESNVFGGLPIAARPETLHAGVAVVDAASGRVEGVLRFTAACDEVFDVAVLRGRHRIQLDAAV